MSRREWIAALAGAVLLLALYADRQQADMESACRDQVAARSSQ